MNVTPRILIFCTRFSPSNASGMLNLCFFYLPTKAIFSLLLRFRDRLLEVENMIMLEFVGSDIGVDSGYYNCE